MQTVDPSIIEKAKSWTTGAYDEETRARVQYLLDHDPDELVESFYRDLEFGTGGLRGIMGAGTNRMNRYTVGMATQGLANYLHRMFPGRNGLSAAIAFDSRNNSSYFAQVAAEVLAGNGIRVFLFGELRPTPVLSFAIRHLKCQTGIVITASHNPKEYNGYKVYWEDGGQLINPHDENVIAEVTQIRGMDEVKFGGDPDLIIPAGEEVDQAYCGKVRSLSMSPEAIRAHDPKIVYSPLHGSGVKLVPRCLADFGFTRVVHVPEQDVSDGNFPTIKSPNPEEPAALSMAIQKALETGADLVMATDPDCDRVGIAIKGPGGEFILLNGNQTASLLTYYLLTRRKQLGLNKGNEFIVKTIVTSELLSNIASSYGVETFDVLTGFKYIADLIKNLEGQKQFIGGGEESYGFLVGDFVRDKDAVIACCMVAETAAWAASQGMTLHDLLVRIFVEFGFYKESLLSVTRKGKAGAEEIRNMMAGFRSNPLKTINQTPVVTIKDYKLQKEKDLKNNTENPIRLPKSDVIQFFLEDGSKITVRPSGTEPKIKFYFGVRGTLPDVSHYAEADRLMDRKLKSMIADLHLA